MILPKIDGVPPRYLWRLTSDGRFANRAYAWEEEPTNKSRGHFDIGTTWLQTLETVYFLRKLINRWEFHCDTEFCLELTLNGTSNRCFVNADEFVSFGKLNLPTWTIDTVRNMATATLADLSNDPLQVAYKIIQPVLANANPNYNNLERLMRILKLSKPNDENIRFMEEQ